MHRGLYIIAQGKTENYPVPLPVPFVCVCIARWRQVILQSCLFLDQLARTNIGTDYSRVTNNLRLPLAIDLGRWPHRIRIMLCIPLMICHLPGALSATPYDFRRGQGSFRDPVPTMNPDCTPEKQDQVQVTLRRESVVFQS